MTKSGRHYVYVHKAPDGSIFYVGKGTGNRAYSKDRQPEWHYYVQQILNGQDSIELVYDCISEEDALRIEDDLLAKYANTVINLQNMYSPVDSQKMVDYNNAIHAYSVSLRLAQRLDKDGKHDQAIAEYETAYSFYIKAMSLNDYYLGARSLLPKPRIAPTQLADYFTKCLAKSGLHLRVVSFAEQFFSVYGEGQTGIELSLKKRAEKSRKKLLL